MERAGNGTGDCLQAETLFLLADGTLTGSEEASARAHVSLCDHCSAELKALEQTIGALSSIPDIPLPAPGRRRLRESLRKAAAQGAAEEPGALRKLWRLLRDAGPAPALAALAAGVMCVLVAFNGIPGGESRTFSGSGDSAQTTLTTVAMAMGDAGAVVNGTRLPAARRDIGTIPLREGDRLSVDQGGTLTLSFPCGVRAKLLARTMCRVFDGWLHIDRGTAYFDVEPQRSGFEVTSPQLSVTVVGTRFKFTVNPGIRSVLELYEGKVRYETRRAAGSLSAGKKLEVSAAGQVAIGPAQGDAGRDIVFDPSKDSPDD